MSGPDVNFPEPTQEERELQREQLEVLRESRALQQEQVRVQELLLPLFFQSAGFDPVFDEEGRLVSIERSEPTEQDTLRGEIEQGFLERSLAALSGDLPVSPGLEREITEGRETLRERLRKQLGPGFETSTPGIEALSNFEQRALELTEGARFGQLTQAEQLSLARTGEQQGMTQDFLNRLLGGANFFTGSIGGLGNVSSSFNPILNRGLAERQGQFQANQLNQSTLFGDLLGLGGTLGGAFLGGGVPFSTLFSCWVAREVYGASNPKWLVFREWLLDKAPAWFRWLYLRYGERFARLIKPMPRLKVIIRTWMDRKIQVV